MKNKNSNKTPLHTVGNLSEHSPTVKMAAAYKKKLLSNAARARVIQIVSINAACMVAIALLFYMLNSNKSANAALIEADPTIPGGENTVQIEAIDIPEKTLTPIQEIEFAMEHLLSSGEAAGITSKDIQPKTSSDFLPLLQQRLMDLNYLEHDEPTTYYGTSTELAVKDFQAQHSLEIDGVVNYQTLLLMFSENAQAKLISLGETGNNIENIQERLIQLGFSIKKTGTFDEPTQASIMAFQFLNDLEQTGSLTQEMETMLFSEGILGIDGCPVPDDYDYESQTLNVSAFIETAYDQLGTKYERGGKKPGSFDCSGLVYYCLNRSGFSIKYMTSSAWRNLKKFQHIDKMEDLQPGDICTFVGHVGIYIGYGKMIDASMSEGQVRISSDITSKSYWKQNWDGGLRLPTA